MSSQNVAESICEDTRVVTKNITSIPLIQSPQQKSDNNNNTMLKTAKDEICFTGEFADVRLARRSNAGNLSSASSSTGLDLDISDNVNISYMIPDISGLEELIVECGNIDLQCDQISQDLSQDASFVSASETFSHISDYDFKDLLNVKDEREEQYSEFKPQRQSTTLSLLTQEEELDSKDLRLTEQEVTNGLLNSLSGLMNETNQFVSATSEIVQGPSSFDFLLTGSNNSGHTNCHRVESSYVKFDPLVSNTSISPRINSLSRNEKQTDSENEMLLPDAGTPELNVTTAAIDRLPSCNSSFDGTLRKLEESQKRIDSKENPKSDVSVININMNKELEVVRDTVLQQEEELKKQKRHEAILEKQITLLQEETNKLQTQLTQKMNANTIVMEKYEKSISILSTERERDRTNFEQEKTKLQEELQEAYNHLANIEVAFNDVHEKYERLKKVVAMYRYNENVLTEYQQENVDTITKLTTRYNLLKNHVNEQMVNANLELDKIQKQNEVEKVKLCTTISKLELEINSLHEVLEQKKKENKVLIELIDEIARVSHKQV